MENTRRVLPLVALCSALAFTGCTTYQQQNKFAPKYAQGDFVTAELEARKKADREEKGKDAMIWRLEVATILRHSGKYQESNDAFVKAEQRLKQYEDQAKVSVSKETGALLSNQAQLPYRGRAYDGIMLHTYKALNYLQLSDLDNMRIELNAAHEQQKKALEDNKKRIEEVEKELAEQKDKEKEQIQKAKDDEKLKGQLEKVSTDLSQIKAYADYENPFTYYIDGLFSMTQGTSQDLDRARQNFKKVLSCTGENKFVQQDLLTTESLAEGKSLEPTTYVIFETGLAPIREQIRIDIPIIVSSVSYVGAAFPKLKFQEAYLPALQVTANGTNDGTALVASVDSIVANDFKNELPTIVTKTVASTVIKAAASYAVNEAAGQQSQMAGLISQLGTAIYQAAVNIADLRTWTTLPKEFHVCRVPTPQDRKLVLAGATGTSPTEVTVDEGTINLVFVKSVAPNAPMLVSQAKLK